MNSEPAQTSFIERKVVRRGLLAGLSGLGAAAMLKIAGASKAEADHDGAAAYNPAEVMHVGVINDGGAATNLETATNLTTRTSLVASISGGANATLRVVNVGAGGAALDGIASGNGGDGVRGTGGVMAGSVGADDGRGLVGTGGASSNSIQGGLGVHAIGGASGSGVGGKGVSAAGGSSTTGTGGPGIQAQGGGGPTPGEGVVGLAGGFTSGSQANGVRGQTSSTTNSGVRGVNTSTGPGVSGQTNSTTNGGVSGVNLGSGPGVRGAASNGAGVLGVSDTQPGVFGQSSSAPGVDGVSTGSLGIRGTSTNFVGIVGISTNNHGLYGTTSSASAIGVVAENTAGGMGLLVTGNAQVFGSFQVFGAKNAVIKMQDGTNAAVYCQESPEPYFEDFGEARLVNGVAQVALEPEFAALVSGSKYMVFLTAEGATQALYVSRKSGNGFEVRENGGTSNVPFSYRIVTRRKDIEGKRFARVSDDAKKGAAAARSVIERTPRPMGRPQGLDLLSPSAPPEPVLPLGPNPTLPLGPTGPALESTGHPQNVVS